MCPPATAVLDPTAADADDPDDAAHEWRHAVVPPDGHGQRLDHRLVIMAPEFSRSHLQGLVERGHAQVDGVVQTAASRKLKVGQRIDLELVPTAQSLAFRPEAMALNLVYEDEHLLVVDKPAGLVVHPAAGHWSGTLLNGLLAHHAGARMLPRAGIVHRLDKDTTGLMVVAKTLPAMTGLVRRIADREVRRIYLALVVGEVKWAEASIDAPIGRDPGSRLRMAVVASGKPARTDVARLLATDGVTALRCRLHTGRTHQIRVHLAHRGFPLVADALYGGRPLRGLLRQALHATELAFEHPVDGRPMVFHSPLPADLLQAWPIDAEGFPAGMGLQSA
ncbi:RluA family pseudouridine synthase [Ideonella sp. A 288]|uniref:RluA family pseudouridine synthase n=1 Tax=Ideonella sp. A 288 TaxID=1962181 RepID=UPI000B4ADCAF|nr:RluA family pseudouridine synthase [Ideonella sp. A 288]